MAFIAVCYPSLIGFSFALALTFYPSAGPCRGPQELSRINTKTPQRSSAAAIGMQEGDNHAFYCSLLEDSGHARSSLGGGSSQCRRSSQLVSSIASAGPL